MNGKKANKLTKKYLQYISNTIDREIEKLAKSIKHTAYYEWKKSKTIAKNG